MNYYETLEIHPKASKEVVRAAYKSLMQRYHPDKNPDNAEAARHAALIAQAYGVISDDNQRSLYDLQLREQAEKVYSRRSENYPAQPLRRTPPNRQAVAKNNAWYAWLLISVILLSGFLILFLAPKKPPQPLPHLDAQAEGGAQAVKQNSANLAPQSLPLPPPPSEPGQRPAGLVAKTLQLSSSVMTLSLKDENQRDHVLSIPLLFIKVGSYDSEKFIRDVERRKDAINRQLADRLTYASYEELARKDEGEKYLKKFILDALDSITGTNRFEEYPPTGLESPGRYGAVDIILLEPFSLK
ncbi:MAG: J domain-containing protein [Polaromonas sp.]|nr:J domain-containing protein [Polaromonas sp.]